MGIEARTLREVPQDLGIEFSRDRFPVVAYEPHLDIAPGRARMVGAHLSPPGGQCDETSRVHGATDVFPLQHRILQK